MDNSSNSKKLPSVGVVIRTFNSDKYLKDSIESVINQNYSPMEIVVVDGGSTDQTIEIISGLFPEVKIIRQIRPGLGGAAQDGIEALDTDLIAFQDSDDIWTAGRLKQMVESLIDCIDLAAVLGAVEHFLSPELDQNEHQNLLIHKGLQPGFGLPALLIYKKVFNQIGPFAEGFPYGEYMEFIDRFRLKGLQIKQLDISSLKRRVHKSNYTQGVELRSNMLEALHMIIARRRNGK
jgi:glycosyltransferase involved in cell wall biosynthesis